MNFFSGWSLVLIGFAEVLVYGWVYGEFNKIVQNNYVEDSQPTTRPIGPLI